MSDRIVMCPYCHSPATLVSGDVIYPHHGILHGLRFWQCAPCDAYVGVHKNSPNAAPMGRLANAELRAMKVRAHAVFDPLWRTEGMTRREAYAWAADALGISSKQMHIGKFDVESCRRLIDAVLNKGM